MWENNSHFSKISPIWYLTGNKEKGYPKYKAHMSDCIGNPWPHFLHKRSDNKVKLILQSHRKAISLHSQIHTFKKTTKSFSVLESD